MENYWQLQEAKSRFSRLVEQAIEEGPQFVTKHGRDSVVILSRRDYDNLKRPKEDLLSFFKKAPRADLDTTRSTDFDRDVQL